jgi:hypothetical protein
MGKKKEEDKKKINEMLRKLPLTGVHLSIEMRCINGTVAHFTILILLT